MFESTVTGSSGDTAAVAPAGRPQLVVVALADDMQAPSSRHLLDDIDEVRFARGPRTVRRRDRVLELGLPDRRMSREHGRLVRGPAGWVLDDPHSKNGSVVAGELVRRAYVEPGAVIEVGHAVLVLRVAPTEAGAPDDLEAPPRPDALASLHGPLVDRFAALAQVAVASDVPVLLRGATGTGKEVVARAVHTLTRRPGPFVAVDCGAVATGALELVRGADRGTLFFDEIANLSPVAQAALLRVVQDRAVPTCAATAGDVGAIRRDLYARLAGLELELPALRERICDLGTLIRALLPDAATTRFAPAALRALLRYTWPHNIRELANALEVAAALAHGVIEVAHLPRVVRAPTGDDADRLRARLIELLEVHRGNVIAVGKALGTRRTQVYRWIRRYGLELARFRM